MTPHPVAFLIRCTVPDCDSFDAEPTASGEHTGASISVRCRKHLRPLPFAFATLCPFCSTEHDAFMGAAGEEHVEIPLGDIVCLTPECRAKQMLLDADIQKRHAAWKSLDNQEIRWCE